MSTFMQNRTKLTIFLLTLIFSAWQFSPASAKGWEIPPRDFPAPPAVSPWEFPSFSPAQAAPASNSQVSTLSACGGASGVSLYDQIDCTGNSVFTSTIGYVATGDFETKIQSIDFQAGWNVRLFLGDPGGLSVCLSSSDANLNDNYYPGTSTPVAGHVHVTRVFDSAGCSGDIIDPTVSWTSPVANDQSFITTPGQTISLSVSAQDNVGISKVHLARYDNLTSQWVNIADLTNSPYSVSINSNSLNLGSNLLQVFAVDTSGNYSGYKSITIIVNTTPPGSFSKISPVSASYAGTYPELKWGASAGADTYQVCLVPVPQTCSWTSTFATSYYPPSPLTINTMYQWRVVAVNGYGSTEANYTNSPWYFTVTNPPGAFNKYVSVTNATATLSWDASSNASSYEYCVDQTDDSACDNDLWTSSGTALSASVGGLTKATTYYWQVRARNALTTTGANGGFSAFSTADVQNPQKYFPVNNALNVSLNPQLSWGTAVSVGVTYEYCIFTAPATACSSWISTGANNYVNVYDLNPNSVYYWQVRATNFWGVGYGGGSPTSYFAFTTGSTSGAFYKATPINGLVNGPLSFTLAWGQSSGATRYEYCLATLSTICTPTYGNWISVGNNSQVQINTSTFYQKYYWQVRAFNGTGYAYANARYPNGIWSFTTGGPPGNFSKLSPLSGADGVSLTPVLKWQASANAVYYAYCIHTTYEPTCSPWVDTLTATSAVPSASLTPNTTYYWRVKAINKFGTTISDGSFANGDYTFTTATIGGYASTSTRDGWVLESTQFSSVGGSLSNSGYLQVGDDAANRQYKTFLDFSTGSLPDRAVIKRVTLKIKIYGVVGTTSPFKTLGPLTLDIHLNPFGNPWLEKTDFQAMPSKSNIGTLSPVSGQPGWYQVVLASSNFIYINRLGLTQFRIHFTKTDDGDRVADFARIYGGDAISSLRPSLRIEYYIP